MKLSTALKDSLDGGAYRDMGPKEGYNPLVEQLTAATVPYHSSAALTDSPSSRCQWLRSNFCHSTKGNSSIEPYCTQTKSDSMSENDVTQSALPQPRLYIEETYSQTSKAIVPPDATQKKAITPTVRSVPATSPPRQTTQEPIVKRTTGYEAAAEPTAPTIEKHKTLKESIGALLRSTWKDLGLHLFTNIERARQRQVKYCTYAELLPSSHHTWLRLNCLGDQANICAGQCMAEGTTEENFPRRAGSSANAKGQLYHISTTDDVHMNSEKTYASDRP